MDTTDGGYWSYSRGLAVQRSVTDGDMTMHIDSIVEFWRGQQAADDQRRWMHRADRKVLDAGPHSFNLDHPVSPYIGDVLNARVIIMNANAGYKSHITPTEFPDEAAITSYVERVDSPSKADWSFVSRYYDDTNYGHLIGPGNVVVVNACAYRSPLLSEEDDNQRIIPRLPSAIFMRRWLLEAVLPAAKQGHRLIVRKRGGQWRLPPTFATSDGVSADPHPRFPRLSQGQMTDITEFLAKQP